MQNLMHFTINVEFGVQIQKNMDISTLTFNQLACPRQSNSLSFGKALVLFFVGREDLTSGAQVLQSKVDVSAADTSPFLPQLHVSFTAIF